MNLDVLAFAAHRDDIEITCGGTLARLVEQGHAVGACDLTMGEMGTRGSASERQAEAEAAARILGLKARVNCELPDAGLFNVREQQLRIVDVLRRYRPRVVLVPSLDQRHPDHATTPRLVFDACYVAGLAKFPDLKHDANRAHRPKKIFWVHSSWTPAPPTFVVDITAQMDKKLASILAYRTQFPREPSGPSARSPEDEIVEWTRGRGRTYGMMIGRTYGEGFSQREMMEVEDLARVPGASI
ncbi:MAG: bacillithiol biosynthesis deacetylase BshB1 [Planctomycetes bacterium]|nr:bacillithiol biosynthesis deacetylase BshB1 [Planctomycetota bacterium]